MASARQRPSVQRQAPSLEPRGCWVSEKDAERSLFNYLDGASFEMKDFFDRVDVDKSGTLTVRAWRRRHVGLGWRV